MGTGIVVAFMIIGFSTVTFLVGLGIGHIIGEAKAEKQHRQEDERATETAMRVGRVIMLRSQQRGSTEDARVVGDHGEAVH